MIHITLALPQIGTLAILFIALYAAGVIISFFFLANALMRLWVDYKLKEVEKLKSLFADYRIIKELENSRKEQTEKE